MNVLEVFSSFFRVLLSKHSLRVPQMNITVQHVTLKLLFRNIIEGSDR